MAPFTEGPALESLALVIENVLQYAMWPIVIGYIYFFWKLIFGPGGNSGSSWGAGQKAKEWIGEKASDIADWNGKRKKAAKDLKQATDFSLLEYQDLEKLKTIVTKAKNEKDLEKLKRAKSAAKRHEAKATARFGNMESDLASDAFKDLFTKDPKFKIQVAAIVKKIKPLNALVILEINNFDTSLRTPITPPVDTAKIQNKVTTELLPPLERALTAERGIQVEFQVLKDLLIKKLGKMPKFSLW